MQISAGKFPYLLCYIRVRMHCNSHILHLSNAHHEAVTPLWAPEGFHFNKDTFPHKLDYCQQQQHMHVGQRNKQQFSSNISKTWSCRLAKWTTCTTDIAVHAINQKRIALLSAQHSGSNGDLLHVNKSSATGTARHCCDKAKPSCGQKAQPHKSWLLSQTPHANHVLQELLLPDIPHNNPFCNANLGCWWGKVSPCVICLPPCIMAGSNSLTLYNKHSLLSTNSAASDANGKFVQQCGPIPPGWAHYPSEDGHIVCYPW